MTRQVLFLQGAGTGAYEEDAKLAADLRRKLGPGYHVRYPQMPDEDAPDYHPWAQTIAREVDAMGDGALLVGHSLGASLLAKWLTERKSSRSFAGVFLVAGPFWHDDETWRWHEAELPRDAGTRLPEGMPVYLYHGEEDEIVPFAHLGLYAALLPQAAVRPLKGRNHQLNDDLSEVASDIKGLG
jgi:predicted alpha/beta hydrolase family esterase